MASVKLNPTLFHYNPFQYEWHYIKITFSCPTELREKDNQLHYDLLKPVPHKLQPRIFI